VCVHVCACARAWCGIVCYPVRKFGLSLLTSSPPVKQETGAVLALTMRISHRVEPDATGVNPHAYVRVG